jgi:electron transport complex protein RnfB
MAEKKDNKLTRRAVLGHAARGAALVGVGGVLGWVVKSAQADDKVWQLDPRKCTACGNCATFCVLEPSAVKAVHTYAICGYCELCFGYFDPDADPSNPAAENQLCPVNAIGRIHIEGPYYEYPVDEDLCVGCGKCVQGCALSGNGSLHLQVRHDRCLNCNECSIAAACPSEAFVRVDARKPYLMKNRDLP